MKFADWKDRTKRIARSKGFDRVAEHAKQFLEAPTAAHADQLEKSLTTWITWFWNLWEAADDSALAMKQLYLQMTDVLYQRAVQALGNQAINLYARYGDWLPDDYKVTLRAVFIEPVSPAVNFKWYQLAADFQSRFRTLMPAKAGMAVFVSGFTYPLSPLRQNRLFPAVYGHLTPGDRVIELTPNFDNGTAFHELLHWVTHARFEEEVAKIREKQFDIIEGVTEYFTRQIRSEHTSYEEQWRTITDAVTARRPIISEDMLKKAYFGGANAESVAYALATLTDIADDARRTRESAEQDRFKLAEGKRKADLLHQNRMWGRRIAQTRAFWDDDVITYVAGTPIDQLKRDYGWDDAFAARIQTKLREFGVLK